MATFFKESLFVLSKNPILFLLPLVGSVISIIVEVIFTIELYYSNGNKVFFPNIILFGLFFAGFNIIPTGVVIILLSTVASFSFGAWLVQYVVIKEQNMPYGILMPLRRLGHD